MKLTIGCATRPYSDLPFAEACQHIAAAGYTDVAIYVNEREVPVHSNSTKAEILAIRKIATDAGLVPSMLLVWPPIDLEVGLPVAVANYKRLIDNAALLGADWLQDVGINQEEFFDDYFALVQEVAPYAESAGVGIALKPHGGISLTVEDLIAAHRRVNHPAFGICYDPASILYYTEGERRPEPDVSKVAPLVTTAIIKDCVVKNDTPDVMITPGEDLVDFDAILSDLVAGGFRGPVYVECVGGESLDEIDRNVRRTLAFVQDIVTSLPGGGQGGGDS